MCPEHLRHLQHQICRSSALGELAGEPETDHFRQQHVDRLADHDRLGFDSADAPANHTETVDHRRVAVGSDQAVRVEGVTVVPHHLGQILEVDLVDDSGGRRNDPEVIESGLTPLQKFVPLLVPLELLVGVDLERHPGVESIDLNRVVDHQIAGDQRIDLLGCCFVTHHLDDGRSHGRQIDHRGYACEVLQDDAPRRECDLGLTHFGGVVRCDCPDVFIGYCMAVEIPKGGFQQHLDGIRE